MVYLIEDKPQPVKKQYRVKMPDITGKFGIAFAFGKKEIFIGIAVSNVEMETVVRHKKLRINVAKGKGVFMPTS